MKNEEKLKKWKKIGPPWIRTSDHKESKIENQELYQLSYIISPCNTSKNKQVIHYDDFWNARDFKNWNIFWPHFLSWTKDSTRLHLDLLMSYSQGFGLSKNVVFVSPYIPFLKLWFFFCHWLLNKNWKILKIWNFCYVWSLGMTINVKNIANWIWFIKLLYVDLHLSQ